MIKQHNISLVDIVDGDFNISLTPNSYYSDFINILKTFLSRKPLGQNIIRYLLLDMRNSVIKAQTYRPKGDMPEFNQKFDNLRIRLGSKAFELMPFAFNPKESNPSIYTLINLFDVSTCNDEILYRNIAEYIKQNNTLFIKPKDIGYKDDKFIELMESFNYKLKYINQYYLNYIIVKEYDYYTIEAYYDVTKNVILQINKLRKLKKIDLNTDYSSNKFLKENQKKILQKMFKNSSIELVTGSAGTGKTTLIKEFIKNNCNKSIMCLTTTNTANNNLKIKEYDNINLVYKNISQFEKEKLHKYYDIIIIDEASFISTKSINNILLYYQNSLFLIVGDPNQIESIEFGNWFLLLLNIMNRHNIVNILEEELRTNVKELSSVWKEIKEGAKNNTLELLSSFDMTEKLSDKIFEIKEGEVVLCLNYDGLYGINNINRYLQASNKNLAYEYQQNLYKKNDPVIFVINDYSDYGIYNNLKGKIVDIKDNDNKIVFKIELFDKVNYKGRLSNELLITKENDVYYAIVEKNKYYTDEYDSDMDTRTKLPFQISYAMSIHKAQGLEFKSVKIVITKETDELITKNIFYTAVTRAKEKLKIYWEPEVANQVLDRIEKETEANKVDLLILQTFLKIYNII